MHLEETEWRLKVQIVKLFPGCLGLCTHYVQFAKLKIMPSLHLTLTGFFKLQLWQKRKLKLELANLSFYLIYMLTHVDLDKP